MDEYRAELTRLLRVFGDNVRRIRVERHLSQEQLAARTVLHRTEIGKIEQGTVEPRLTTLSILADGLGVTVDQLLEDMWAPVQRKPSPSRARTSKASTAPPAATPAVSPAGGGERRLGSGG
jgi:transcriptional regulator with XRE-family HTH domain